MDLLARLQSCTIFSSLDLKLGYYHIRSTPEAKPQTAFATGGKQHWNMASFSMCSLSGAFCYLMSQILSGLAFCFTYLDNTLVYSVSWKEHLQHLKVVF